MNINFTHEGIEYQASFGYVEEIPMKFQIFYLRDARLGTHLGKLWMRNGEWVFDDEFPERKLSELADYFGDYVTNWFG